MEEKEEELRELVEGKEEGVRVIVRGEFNARAGERGGKGLQRRRRGNWEKFQSKKINVLGEG